MDVGTWTTRHSRKFGGSRSALRPCARSHLLEDDLTELAQHPLPVGVLVRLRVARRDVADETFEHGHVEGNRLAQVGALHLDGDLLARVQARAVDLSERGGGHRPGVDLGVQLRELAAEFALDARVSLGGREGRHLVLQGGQFFDVGERQEVCARGERLPDLDEGRPQADEAAPQPRGLPVESLVALLRAARASEDEAAHRAREQVGGLPVNVATPLLEKRDAAARARLPRRRGPRAG